MHTTTWQVARPDGAFLALTNHVANNDAKTPQGFFGRFDGDRGAARINNHPRQARAGDDGARGEVISKIYEELRHVAARMMHRERASHTLSPTAVVHEAVVRLLGEVGLRSGDRPEFSVCCGRAGHARDPCRTRKTTGRRAAWRQLGARAARLR